MEEELILQQPPDRRLGDNNTLPPGPPGVENETSDLESKSAPPPKAPPVEKEKSASERSSRRRSPSGSPPPIRKRKSPSRTRRSPSPPVRSRGRRSPSPRRNRYRDYSPDRRPRFGGRRSPDRRRSPIRRGGGRDRYRGRGRSASRSISRSPSPPTRRGRWSPKKKPNSPPQQQQPPPMARQIPQPQPTPNQPPPQYGVMAPPPPQIYGGEAYGPPPGYNQYGVPPPQTSFVPPNDAYVNMQTQNAGFNTAYPPPGAWGVDAYGQQQWLPPPPTQMQQMPAPPQQQQPPPQMVVTTQNTPQPIPTNVPPPTTLPTAPVVSKHATVSDEAPGTVDPNPQHDAVAQEAENQRDELKKQRTSYLKKTTILKKELKMLKEQRKELHGGGTPASPTTKSFIEENEKLQNQIQKKLSTIENVIDMLTGIIGEENLDKDDENLEDDSALKEAALSSLQKPHVDRGSTTQTTTISVAAQKKKSRRSSSSSSESSSGSSSSSSSESSSSETETPYNKEDDDDDDSSPERLKKKVIESMKNKDKEVAKTKQELRVPSKKERFNYVFYDPEMHWCQTCNVFPKTAKDFLNHLHTRNHMDRESIETPWHTDMVTDQFPAYDNAPTKRTPIRGLTFFVPATAWFCKLCNIWMGDLHCASTHLKSQLHANRYNSFLEENPHYEVNWLADRQIALNEHKLTPLPQQITSVSTTAAERKKLKKDDDKTNKKRKKKSDKKQKKKKKKSNKKRKKESDSSSSTSSDSSSSSDSDEHKKKKPSIPVQVKDNLDNPNPAVSIRLSMRKQENMKNDDSDVAPPPPSLKVTQASPLTAATAAAAAAAATAAGKWMVIQEGVKHKEADRMTDADDSIIQQWNTVQPVISESEKKLLEQLKGKLKNKSKDEQQSKSSTAKADNEKENRDRERDRDRDKNERDSRSERDRGVRDRDSGKGRGDDRDRRTTRRSRTRSPTRSRSRGRDYRRNVRRSLSRNRGRMSPRGWRNNRNRRDRSRSRSPRRRTRSPYDRRRRSSKSRSRSTSRGGTRVEKPVVKPAEFRPRVPEKDKEKDKKSSESKDKKDKAKQKSTSSTTAAANAAAGKKLPFIGKMPVFKKQVSGAPGENEKRPEDLQANGNQQAGPYMYNMDATNAFTRPPAPTAAQIQMAMMEDVYGNAPPFHPDAGMMVDYDDLMPDPVQFVNIMGQAPPPPPPQATEDDKDMLPPGIDMEESEEFVPKPITDGPPPGKGPLPKDLEDALNIIFPGEKKPGDESDTEEGDSGKLKKAKGETQIINDEAVIKPEELAREGIHLVTFEETSHLGLDEASQMSMNEPLQFNRPPSNPTTTTINKTAADMELEDANSQNMLDLNIAAIVPPPPPETETFSSPKEIIEIETETEIEIQQTAATSPQKLSTPNEEEQPINTEIIPDIPMPAEDIICETELNTSTEMDISKEEGEEDEEKVDDAKEELEHNEFIHITNDIDLADIPQPPPSPTESEKKRRQEELNDLAMLGIDADDMAAQCM